MGTAFCHMPPRKGSINHTDMTRSTKVTVAPTSGHPLRSQWGSHPDYLPAHLTFATPTWRAGRPQSVVKVGEPRLSKGRWEDGMAMRTATWMAAGRSLLEGRAVLRGRRSPSSSV